MFEFGLQRIDLGFQLCIFVLQLKQVWKLHLVEKSKQIYGMAVTDPHLQYQIFELCFWVLFTLQDLQQVFDCQTLYFIQIRCHVVWILIVIVDIWRRAKCYIFGYFVMIVHIVSVVVFVMIVVVHVVIIVVILIVVSELMIAQTVPWDKADKIQRQFFFWKCLFGTYL